MLLENTIDFESLQIGLASPDRIRFWSYGEVEKPETINYRTFKPERKGLFCEKIFGPVKDWECSCGKYRRVRYRGIVCERCGVEVTHSKVRRERMGHLELAAPVTHIWFLKGIPGYLGLILDMTTRSLEEVIYYDSYIVTKVDDSINEYSLKQIVPTSEYFDIKEKYGDKVVIEIGASAIKSLLAQIQIEQLIKQLRKEMLEVKGQKRIKVTKRLRIVEAIEKSGNKPEWLVLDVVPIMPPDLRPMVQLEGGRFATSDLNDLYRRVVNRNNRLKRLMDIGAPDMIVRNEKRMLQEAVDVLISNGKRGRSVTGSNGRPLKSLGNIIEGKQGRFRQNLLGKRVDYSARSVIVVGPYLQLHQCGLPKEMALELFKPFVIRKLVELGIVTNVKSAKRKIEKRDVAVWDILEGVIKGQSILLNRAPTLHRLGIQAFEPILVEGSAIQIHPLVCTAFNADFDGDQMAVHVPLSVEAQSECKLLIQANNNILTPSSGRSIVTPTQDMILGLYFLTITNPNVKKSDTTCFSNIDEAWRSYQSKSIHLQSDILIRLDGTRIETTMGRLIFNENVREILSENNIKAEPFINDVIGKKFLNELVYHWYLDYGNEVTSHIINRLKTIGFRHSTLSGLSISIDDLTVPESKAKILEDANTEVEKLEKLEKKGNISHADKVLLGHEVWRGATQKISAALTESMGELNNVYIMANSGARGNMDQVRQLAGMRGLMSDSQGRTVEIPIRSNFKEGLSLTEYFISAYGARKGLVDTALRTADSGYLTRRLVDVAQDVMITIEDCGTDKGMELYAITSGLKTVVPISEMIEGRITLEPVKDPITNEIILEKGMMITRAISQDIENAGVKKVITRSVYQCLAEKGLCQHCYGLDLATAKEINLGEAVGIIAAQSIGEPGTQLTMRTFHTGGVDLRKASRVEINANFDGTIEFEKDIEIRKIEDEGQTRWVSINKGSVSIKSKDKNEDFLIPVLGQLQVKDKQKVSKGDVIAAYDPFDVYRTSNIEGIVKVNCEISDDKNEKGKVLGSIAKSEGEIFIYNPNETIKVLVLSDVKETLKVGDRLLGEQINDDSITIGGIVLKIGSKEISEKRKTTTSYEIEISQGQAYFLLPGDRLLVSDKDKVSKGDIILKERLDSEQASKTEDIVQGLPKVEELFEARKPKDMAILSEVAGVAEIQATKFFWKVIIYTENDTKKEYKVPKDSRLLVSTNQEIKIGDQINSGSKNPHDIAITKDIDETQQYLSESVQAVYRSQGVSINSKHIEVIVRQMTRKVTITEMGDSSLLIGEMLEGRRFRGINEKLEANGKEKAEGKRTLLGITRASLSTESFVSASSFQQTASVLTKAAIEGQHDPMKGLKENVIIGNLIPAGTGLPFYKNVGLENDEDAYIEESIELDIKEKVHS
jgi:DNA-directed RNA polymerase subunit beta'